MKPPDIIQDRRHIYFVGIGGVGMSSLARVLKGCGFRVSGSDLKSSRRTRELENEGIEVFIGQQETHFEDVDLVVYSSAIHADHVEIRQAREKGIAIHHRAEVLSSLLNRAQTAVAVTGTHGKTTTTSMISFVLSRLEKNPTCLIGGDLRNWGTNMRLGGSGPWVAEVDESDRTHELYRPHYVILTNLEEEHIDHYPTYEDLTASFKKFLGTLSDPGVVICCKDDARLDLLVAASGRPRITFGLSQEADFSASNIRLFPYGSEFDLLEAGFQTLHVELSVPGIHNILNATAALALLMQLGIPAEQAALSLKEFCGAKRRLEVLWEDERLVVIDDYAHHPTELRYSLEAMKVMRKNTTVVFQPHRFSRTQRFYKEFAETLKLADRILLMDVYGAGERVSDPSGAGLIERSLAERGRNDVRILRKNELLAVLQELEFQDDVLAFVGAGDIGEIAHEFVSRIKGAHSVAG
ncbi:MAG: UDP-N-acetylmuramate--L-alanine ligase [Candidatus Omnitrophota bacterium]